ncbi:MAG: hypothetical protein E7448_00940 [Ruminococcaceae bacterium]|nr:hypothetical protein [Oscillospiraceae bacterium]
MQLKQYDRYIVDFKSKWTTRCAALLGVSLFVRVVYFFGIKNLTECGAGQVIFDMVLTMGLCVGFLVMFSALRRNAPGLYALMGAGFCLLLMISTFSSGNALRIVLAIVGYLLAGTILVITVSGYLPGKLLSSVMFLLPMAVRFLAFDLGKIGLFTWVIELSWLLTLASMFCFTRGMKPYKRNEK